jgi:hypothetical protein
MPLNSGGNGPDCLKASTGYIKEGESMELLKRYFRRNRNVSWRKLENKCILLHLDSAMYYTLDQVGSFIWEAMDGKTPLQAIHKQIVDQYDIDADTAKSDFLGFVEDLIEEDLVEPHEAPPKDG